MGETGSDVRTALRYILESESARFNVMDKEFAESVLIAIEGTKN